MTSGALPTFDVEGQTFDILSYDIEGKMFRVDIELEGRKMTFDIGYDMTTRYRRY
jgi:hypothetical protein